MNHKNRSSTLLLPLLLLGLLTACDNRQEKAQIALEEYQAALVSGDLKAARLALAELVNADDSNADYWQELGKISMQLSDYGAAYGAYQRAHELDRGNAEVLAIMTQLALLSGNLPIAEENAKQLELVAPSNPAVPLTKGYAALRRNDLEEASKQAAAFNSLAPYDSSGKILQARILVAQAKPDEAIALLREQVRQQPSDAMSLRALANLLELTEQWNEAAATLRSYLSWQPNDQGARVRLIEFQLRSNDLAAAEKSTMEALDKQDVDAILAPWLALGRQEAIAGTILSWAQTANFGRRIAAARFLVATNRSDSVLSLIGKEATMPVQPGNTIPNAIYGAALVKAGRTAEGSRRLDAVLAVDGTIREALQARAALRSRAGAHPQAIEDAQKLVATDQTSAAYRLLLARVHAAAGDQEAARRSLWEGFHEIEADRSLYEALKPLVAKAEGPQAAVRLSQEFYDQRHDRIIRSFA